MTVSNYHPVLQSATPADHQHPLQQQQKTQELLKQLDQIENKIIGILTITSQITRHLSEETDISGAKEEVEKKVMVYIETLNEIQILLRSSIREFSHLGILATSERSIPFRANLNGLEKDFELKSQSIALIQKTLLSRLPSQS